MMTMRALRTSRRETARQLLQSEMEKLPVEEREVVERFISRHRVARNIEREFEEQLTLGERVADQVAAFGGSWRFIFLFTGLMAVWMLVNTWLLRQHAFDPYPYILLNLLLSCLAALQAPVIMMSQNRAAEKDRLHAENDYQVNVKAELEIMRLHEKLNELREQDWTALVETQQQQIVLLEQLLSKIKVKSQQ
jgi:uncharacterized membrane protein